MRTPRATYRLQLGPSLTFDDAAGFRLHCTEKSEKSQRARVALPLAPLYCAR